MALLAGVIFGAVLGVAAIMDMAPQWARRHWLLLLLLALLLPFGVWLLQPAVEGWHLGCSVWSGDNHCLTRLGILWGHH
jgi:hypothetical protein